ncbi:MAG: metal-sensing transcriptional repressor [Gammaproteobacteria bacterium]
MPAAKAAAHARDHQRDQAPAHDASTHRTHKDVLNRLRRATGHLQTIGGMIESSRDCADIAQQLHAVIRALEEAKSTLIHDHIEHCLEVAVGPTSRDQRATIDGFKKISRYL